MKRGRAKIEKIDHLGIVAGVIRELRIIETIDKLIGTDDKETITTGETVAGMILNGLGFTSRALSLTPQFFETKAVGRLIREKIEPKNLDRFKLGRSLDKIFDYGCEKFFSSISILVCKKENVDTKFSHGDTSSFSLNGEYELDFDSQPLKIVRGYSKDKRSDLKQIILKLVNTQDGGMPPLMKTWSGNESDSNILRKRVKAFINEFKHGESLRCFVADSKLYDKKTSSFLKQIDLFRNFNF
jgi:transposase